MVIAHSPCNQALQSFIYQFHMPLFFIISGFFYQENTIPKVFILKRIKRLYIPFVKYSFLFLFCFCAISYFAQGTFGYSADALLRLSVLFLLDVGYSPLSGPLWFLRVLLIVSILFVGIRFLISKVLTNVMYREILFIFFVVACLLIGRFTNLPYNLSAPFIALFFFYAGYLYKKNQNGVKFNIIFAVLAFVIVLLLSRYNRCDMFFNRYDSLSLFLISGVLGTYFTLCICRINLIHTAHTHILSLHLDDLLENIGVNSMIILAWHFTCFKLVNLIVVLVYHLPFNRILDHPTITDYPYVWILYTSLGLGIPMLMQKCRNLQCRSVNSG
jgi:fucose 4-O-acetylase-like acetyltransferase